MDLQRRASLVDSYRSGYDAVLAALDGITPAELDRDAPGEWSSRRIVHHLADSETTSFLRLRRLLAEDDALIQGYDENVWARQRWYGGPIEPSLAVLQAVRESSAALIELLTDDDFARSGTHSESGPGYTVATWLEIYAQHPHDHADQILRARRGYTD